MSTPSRYAPTPRQLLERLRVTSAEIAAAPLEERHKLGLRRGVYCEARVLYAVRVRALPPWLRDVRAASKFEDRGGADVIFELADGREIPLQVKGGWSNARLWRRRYGRGQCPAMVVVQDKLSHAKLGELALREVAQAAGLWHEPEARGGHRWFRHLAAAWFARH